MRAVVSTDYPHHSAPHRERQRRFQQAREIFMERGLVDYGAAVLAAQIRRPRRQRDDLVPRRETNPVREDVAALVFDYNLLDRFGRAIEAPRPSRRRFDKLERHVLVVADIPSVDSGPSSRSRAERPIRSLGPGDPDAPRLLADFHQRLIRQPSPLIGKQYREWFIHWLFRE